MGACAHLVKVLLMMMNATAKKLEHRFLFLTTASDSFPSLNPLLLINLLFHLIDTHAGSALLCSLVPPASSGSLSLLTHPGSHDSSFQIHFWQHFFIHHPLTICLTCRTSLQPCHPFSLLLLSGCQMLLGKIS